MYVKSLRFEDEPDYRYMLNEVKKFKTVSKTNAGLSPMT
jgi:hypothetical protein